MLRQWLLWWKLSNRGKLCLKMIFNRKCPKLYLSKNVWLRIWLEVDWYESPTPTDNKYLVLCFTKPTKMSKLFALPGKAGNATKISRHKKLRFWNNFLLFKCLKKLYETCLHQLGETMPNYLVTPFNKLWMPNCIRVKLVLY